jgi:hypothetical protein
LQKGAIQPALLSLLDLGMAGQVVEEVGTAGDMDMLVPLGHQLVRPMSCLFFSITLG